MAHDCNSSTQEAGELFQVWGQPRHIVSLKQALSTKQDLVSKNEKQQKYPSIQPTISLDLFTKVWQIEKKMCFYWHNCLWK